MKILKKWTLCIVICMLMIASLPLISGQLTQSNVIKDTNGKYLSIFSKTWMKTLGGVDYDIGRAFQQTADGGYIIVGSTENFGIGGTDVWLIKTDENGNELWNKTFGTTDNPQSSEIGTEVLQTSDSGYMVSARIDYNFWMIKTDENGNEEWSKIYSKSTGYSMCKTDDECYIVSGYNSTCRCLWILKVNSSGNEIWQKNFDEFDSKGLSIKLTTDHGYIIAGENYIVKTDENGEENWIITLNNSMQCLDVLQSNDGTFAAIGKKGDWPRNVTGWLMKIDTIGQIVSLKNYRGLFTGYIFKKFHQTSDGGYIITGEADSNIKFWGLLRLKLFIIKTNENGLIIWKRTYGSGNSYDFGIDIIELSSGGYIVLGGTNSYGAGNVDIWLIKTDTNGRVQFLYRVLNLIPILKNLMIMISRIIWESD